MTKPEMPVCQHEPKPYKGRSAEEILALRKEFLNPGIFLYYKKPMMLVEGHMQYAWDESGKRYLDGLGGIVTVSVGHCHPHVVEAARRQNETLQHSTTIYLHPNIAEFAQKLASKFPGELKVCYFVNSGSEANDLALLMARAYTGNYDVISLRNSYHGGNVSGMGMTAHSTWKFNVPHSFGVHHAVCPDPYRGPYGRDDQRQEKNTQQILNNWSILRPRDRSPALLPNPSKVSVASWYSLKDISNMFTDTSAPRAGSVSLTKSRLVLAAPERISGVSKTRELFLTSSQWRKGSGTAAHSRQLSQLLKSPASSQSEFTLILSEVIPLSAP